MSEKILEREIKKCSQLIESARQDIDSAKSTKAPQSTIKHLENRMKVLGKREKRLKAGLSKFQKQANIEGQTKGKKNDATPSVELGDETDKDGD